MVTSTDRVDTRRWLALARRRRDPLTLSQHRHGRVARDNAANYITLMAVAFGVTVILTRAYLVVSGYPQIGDGTFHIAHALWGGLLLVIGATVPLLYSNRSVFAFAALATGIGTGLFVDEIGKFITQRNDYFFPLAAPLIYLAILGCVWLARAVGRWRIDSARARMYVVLDRLTWELDGKLNHERHDVMVGKLDQVLTEDVPDEVRDLAARLRAHLLSETAELSPAPPSRLERTAARLRRFEDRWLPRRRLRRVLMVSKFLLGALYVIEVWVIVRLVRDPEGTRQALREVVTNQSVSGWKSVIVVGLVWFFDVLNGILLLACAWLLFRKRDARATALGRIALLFSLTVVNVLAAYFDVEEVLVACAIELLVFLGIRRYQIRFLAPQEEVAPARGTPSAATAAPTQPGLAWAAKRDVAAD
ncbi:MAG: hypothetical protein ACXV5Q_03935 [Frankiaceae bacterium]